MMNSPDGGLRVCQKRLYLVIKILTIPDQDWSELIQTMTVTKLVPIYKAQHPSVSVSLNTLTLKTQNQKKPGFGLNPDGLKTGMSSVETWRRAPLQDIMGCEAQPNNNSDPIFHHS